MVDYLNKCNPVDVHYLEDHCSYEGLELINKVLTLYNKDEIGLYADIDNNEYQVRDTNKYKLDPEMVEVILRWYEGYNADVDWVADEVNKVIGFRESSVIEQIIKGANPRSVLL